jgi:hypothetical protein
MRSEVWKGAKVAEEIEVGGSGDTRIAAEREFCRGRGQRANEGEPEGNGRG